MTRPLRVRLVVSYLGSASTEHATYDQHQRERFLVQDAQSRGHDAALWLLTHRDHVWQPSDDRSTWFFPVDPVRRALPRYFVSTPLLKQFETDRPDLLIFKGMGYRLNGWLVQHSSGRTSFAFIVGGGCSDLVESEACHIFAETQAQMMKHFRHRISAGTVSILPKTIPAHQFIAADRKDFDIISIGKAIPRKNHRALLPLGNRFRVALVGDGPLLPQLRHQAAAAGADIHFFGAVSRSEVPQLIARARVMVHPATNEGFPRVFAESFACGVPVVALRRTAEGCFDHERHGLLVDDQDLVDGVTALLDDSGRLGRMSAEAQRYAQAQFSESATSAAVAPLYQRLQAHHSYAAPGYSRRYWWRRLAWPARVSIWVVRREVGELIKRILRRRRKPQSETSKL